MPGRRTLAKRNGRARPDGGVDDDEPEDAGRPNIPIRLKTAVERGRAIDYAADQMRAIADHLLNSAEGRNGLDLSPRRSASKVRSSGSGERWMVTVDRHCRERR